MRDKSLHCDVLVIGGGVIGLSLAWQLALRGRQVTVLDAGDLGRGASWAGAGILPPGPTREINDSYDQLCSLSHKMHPEWAAQLMEATGIDTGFRKSGGVYLARSPAEAATLRGNELTWEQQGIAFARWSTDELIQNEPELARLGESLRGAWFFPAEYQVRNPRHLRALRAACENLGVRLIENEPVESIGKPSIEFQSHLDIRAGERHYQAEVACICSGAWARRNLLQLGQNNGIMPVRGQMVLYKCEKPLLKAIVNEGHRYLVPRDDGRLLAGSVEEEVGYKIETTPQAIQQIQSWAQGILPQLRACAIERTWAGLRPGSFDGWPYLGAIPGYDNLFVAAGHFRSGLYLSCATASILAELIITGACSIDLFPFRVGRG
ncbi:MAG: glycine oxidase ThiO [Planctomycetales bacterium]|nr:glycine oxidase ThiO [Planctomycetales bacterium]